MLSVSSLCIKSANPKERTGKQKRKRKHRQCFPANQFVHVSHVIAYLLRACEIALSHGGAQAQ